MNTSKILSFGLQTCLAIFCVALYSVMAVFRLASMARLQSWTESREGYKQRFGISGSLLYTLNADNAFSSHNRSAQAIQVSRY